MTTALDLYLTRDLWNRIVDLEAQRDRLRRFAIAQVRYDAENSVDNDFAVSEAALTELDAAWRAISEHGDLRDSRSVFGAALEDVRS